MMVTRRNSICFVFAAILMWLGPGLITLPVAQVILTGDKIKAIKRHGPWPPVFEEDPSNRVSGSALAVEFGRKLFLDPSLSRDGDVACVTCHLPEKGWSDGQETSKGISQLDRNSQSLYNVRNNRWYGLDGRTDSLWAHSIGPMLDEREMGTSPEAIASALAQDAEYSRMYEQVYGEPPDVSDPQAVMVNAAKAIAAFQETIVSWRTPFDDFRDALANGDMEAAGTYPQDAQRGARIFFGKGNCSLCHSGPMFTNGEFADAGMGYFVRPGEVDTGRHGGIEKLRASPFNLSGKFNDNPEQASDWATRQVALHPKTFGEFKIPPLRELTQTAPYMHDGSLATLEDVVRHYSEIDEERLHADGENILRPLKLSEQEIADLVAFLESLSSF